MSQTTNNIVWQASQVSKAKRLSQKQQKSFILWFTGLSGSGKSTIASEVESMLYAQNKHTFLLDGDNLRHGLNKDLRFSQADRVENIRRIGEVAKLFTEAGLIVLAAFISPFKRDRDSVRALVAEHEFIEVFVDVPISTCEARDPKQLYKKARAGQISQFTGIDSPYEQPENPEICIQNHGMSVQQAAQLVLEYLTENKYI